MTASITWRSSSRSTRPSCPPIRMPRWAARADEEWAKNYATYLTDLTAQLSGLLSAAYTPDLVLIDELVKSIEITTH